MKATQQLKEEHEGIRQMLSVMEKICGDLTQGRDLNADHFEKIVDFLKTFADLCHHGKEEGILFPAMADHGIPNAGGPIGVMLYEHEQGRGFIRQMSEGLNAYEKGDKESIKQIVSASEHFIQLLRNHIDKENNILFMMADQVLNEPEQSGIFDEFEKLEVERIGEGKHDEYHQLLKELTAIYL